MILAILIGAGLVLLVTAVVVLAACRAASKAPVVMAPEHVVIADRRPPVPDPLEVQFALPARDHARVPR